jgi:hypothetical protein
MVRRDGQSPRPGWLSDDSIPPSRQSRLFLKKNIFFHFPREVYIGTKAWKPVKCKGLSDTIAFPHEDSLCFYLSCLYASANSSTDPMILAAAWMS